VALERFRRFAQEHAARLPEMFTRTELARAAKVSDGLAEAFAVKEASLKAIGGLTGWELDWCEIGWEGASVALTGAVAAHAKRLRIGAITVSVSRFGEYAMASVIAASRPR